MFSTGPKGLHLPVDVSPKHLKELKRDLNFTNEQICHYAGAAGSTLYRWYDGESRIPVSVIRMFELMLYIEKGKRMISVSWAEPLP